MIESCNFSISFDCRSSGTSSQPESWGPVTTEPQAVTIRPRLRDSQMCSPPNCAKREQLWQSYLYIEPETEPSSYRTTFGEFYWVWPSSCTSGQRTHCSTSCLGCWKALDFVFDPCCLTWRRPGIYSTRHSPRLIRKTCWVTRYIGDKAVFQFCVEVFEGWLGGLCRLRKSDNLDRANMQTKSSLQNHVDDQGGRQPATGGECNLYQPKGRNYSRNQKNIQAYIRVLRDCYACSLFAKLSISFGKNH